ncbi:hypothetical protein [Paradevosia shaoguanensis]|uniref:hypothetical protein n=1 Tax=Paradevosia shaoguanensis TaxID=1335043 RepID=UPI003C76C937
MHQRTFGRRQSPQTSDTVSTGNKWMPLAAIFSFMIIAIVGVMAVTRGESSAPVAQTAEQPLPSHWVTTQRLARYTCPSASCGLVGEFYYREGVDILEERNGFARVTKFYDASCTNGRSDYIDSGPAACTNVNGIENGQFAEWVEISALSTERPGDPAEGATGVAALVGGSDDFNIYRAQFVQAAEKMMTEGICTSEQIKENGGFWASVNLKPRKAYFVRCGSSKYYLDVATGEIWRD